MRVLLISFGSTGDIFPLIGYGKHLQQTGHHVRYATSPLYRAAIDRAGLEYVRLPPDWEKSIFIEFMRELNRAVSPLLQLRHIYEGAMPFMKDLLTKAEEAIADNTDAVVCSYFFPHIRYFAERHGAAFATFAFCHNIVPTTARPPEPFPRLRGLPRPLQRRWNELAWRIGDWAVELALSGAAHQIAYNHSVPAHVSFLRAPAERCLVGVSPLFGEGFPSDDRFRYVGYQRWQSPASEEGEAVLEAFTGGEEVPVITFGSVAFDDVHRIMFRFVKNWPAGKKIIIQSGWAGLSLDRERPEIKLIGEMSHDRLFRYASMVVHHGGAGTTASVLYSGKPHIIVPHIADQHFWASEICRKKVGKRLSKSRWPERLPRAVRRIERNPLYRQNSERVAARLKAEDPQNAVRELEKFVEEWQAKKPQLPSPDKSRPV
ncbi:MAG: glycosyltransferase [Opitutales bacterium]